jgi:hypothetical protein
MEDTLRFSFLAIKCWLDPEAKRMAIWSLSQDLILLIFLIPDFKSGVRIRFRTNYVTAGTMLTPENSG